jgi:hypothetical protein
MKKLTHKTNWFGVFITCIATIFSLESKAGTIAYWRFEPSDLAADSSGNGHVLAITGITSVADKATNAPGTGSAQFDGASFAQTTATIDLTTNAALTIEWFMKTDQQDLGIIYEHSPNYNNNRGGLLGDISEDAAGRISIGNSGQPGYARKDTEIPADGGWHHYAVTIDSVLTSASRMKIYIDGLLATNLTHNALIGNAQPFIDDIFNLGARDGANFFFTGQLDEFRISGELLSPAQFLSPLSYTNAVLTIVEQPADLTVDENSFAAFAIQATVTNAPSSAINYQWQKQDPGGANWQDIIGANETSYTILTAPLAASGTKYRVLLSVLAGQATATSREAILTVKSSSAQSQRVNVTGVQVFDAQTFELNNRGDEANSIDGDLSTFSYSTPSGTASPNIIAFDLGGTNKVNRIRVAKDGDTDALGGLANMDLTILFTTGDGELNTRTYTSVTNLANGFAGRELISAEAVNADGTVLREHHNFATEGFYSLTFQEVAATAIAIRVERDANDPRPFTHYPIHEFEAYDVTGQTLAPSLQIVGSAPNIIVSWPASATGFTLQTTTRLPAAVWSTVSASPVVAGGFNNVTVPISGAAGFYRLSK